jgi:hypothetical protein
MVVMDNPFHILPNKWTELQKLIEVCVKENALLVINWHTDHYHPKEFPGFRDDYLRIIEECQKDSNKFYTLQEYYNEITEREK